VLLALLKVNNSKLFKNIEKTAQQLNEEINNLIYDNSHHLLWCYR